MKRIRNSGSYTKTEGNNPGMLDYRYWPMLAVSALIEETEAVTLERGTETLPTSFILDLLPICILLLNKITRTSTTTHCGCLQCSVISSFPAAVAAPTSPPPPLPIPRAMAERNHHRSKSQLAKSLLSRVSSRGDTSREDVSDSGDAQGRQSIGESVASDSNISLQSTSRSTPRFRPHLSTTMSTGHTQDGPSRSPQGPPPAETSTSTDNAATLEQSVRLFRYFDALRKGDTTAISKAMKDHDSSHTLQGTTMLHLAIQVAEMPVIEFVLSNIAPSELKSGINARDKDGNTPLHLAAKLGRAAVVTLLLDHSEMNDSLTNLRGETPLDVAYSPEIFQQLQLARSLYIEANVKKIHAMVAGKDYGELERTLNDPRIRSNIDVNGNELATDKITLDSGGTLLHESARKKDIKLIQLLLMNGADPFKRDKKGKLPQDVTKDEKTRHILKRSPAAELAQRSVQEKTILGSASAAAGSSAQGDTALGTKDSREMKGYLKKWTNYSGGWKLRWFVLEEGVLSYYKHQGL